MIPKDFQQATADRIVELFKQGQKRILLADEVGLGKTIVAKEVVKQVSKWHEEINDDHFKVIYICSNSNVANQNASKLGIKDMVKVSESRLSMQHLKIYQNSGKDHEYQQLMPMTPATSFTMTSGCGSMQERALIYVHLKRQEVFQPLQEKLKSMLSYGVKNNWQEFIDYYEQQALECNENGSDYINQMDNEIQSRFVKKQEVIHKCIKILTFSGTPPKDEVRDVIKEFRQMFAEISLDKLEPDLVIMDEFQRFKDLISVEQLESEQGMLTNKFFSNKETKVLLLSATPYKPFSTLEEIFENEEMEHYSEFMDLMKFLFHTSHKFNQFKAVWKEYSNSLCQVDRENITLLLTKKDAAQEAMYQSVCRTERLNTGMIDDSRVSELTITQADILSYMYMQSVLDETIEISLEEKHRVPHFKNVPIDYVKSCPYLLSFMDSYKLKKQIEMFAGTRHMDSINKVSSKYLLLNRTKLHNYQKIPFQNARMDLLKNLVFEECKGSENLLWIPASNPYYKADSVFNKNQAFSKVLVFSAWEMVPRMIAALLSYESERLTIGKLYKEEKNKKGKGYFINEDKKKRYGIHRLHNESEDVITYPCTYLSKLYNPKAYLGKNIKEIRVYLRNALNNHLSDLCKTHGIARSGSASARLVVQTMRLLDGEAIEILSIPENIEDILVNIAIGGPASCGLRIFNDDKQLATTLAKDLFVKLFNKPESSAILDLMYKQKKSYYQDVFSYCVDGNLQAMLDEYSHVLHLEGIQLMEAMLEGMAETTSIQIDTLESLIQKHQEKIRIRTHFSVGYFNSRKNDEGAQRAEVLRKSFNSPFRPFVLSTTSVGQEGLDFHNYARKIVHYNLPSNPIDLEQREGRLNRYKCLAVRRTVARLYGNQFDWDEMFEEAKRVEKEKYNDMIPYWYIPSIATSNEKIERMVPLYPLSKDKQKYEHLIKVLSLYRLTLGQPRQEELIDKLQVNIDEINDDFFINLSPITKK